MMKAVNPFKPTAGMNPPELIGRDTVLDDFAEALENGRLISDLSRTH
ncbi:hypothetical protein [Collinsella aerofaciens]|nr:hypothetical protein [Collinsella aerofaciens]MBT9762832.1 hypothetical protein [Collinsella aerofaciens]